jgi:hypothetical protein
LFIRRAGLIFANHSLAGHPLNFTLPHFPVMWAAPVSSLGGGEGGSKCLTRHRFLNIVHCKVEPTGQACHHPTFDGVIFPLRIVGDDLSGADGVRFMSEPPGQNFKSLLQT